jgi:hypothetical protein
MAREAPQYLDPISKHSVLKQTPQSRPVLIPCFPFLFRSILFRYAPMKARCCNANGLPPLPSYALPLKSCSLLLDKVFGWKEWGVVSCWCPLGAANASHRTISLHLACGSPVFTLRQTCTFLYLLPTPLCSPKIGAFAVNIGSGHGFIWIEYGRDFYVHCSRWKVKEKRG